jgi:antitoxin MazE
MTEVTLDLKQWGNNLGVRLPAAIAREANLRAHQRVNIAVIDKQVVITPVEQIVLTLEQRLELFDSERHSGEIMMVSEAQGAEKW